MNDTDRYLQRLESAIELLADTIPKGRQAVADVTLPIGMDELRWRIVDIWRKQEGEDSLFEDDEEVGDERNSD